jgi:hypothetical protein
MKSLFVGAIALAEVLSMVSAAKAQVTSGFMMFITPSYACDGTIRQMTWTAPNSMWLAEVQILNGLSVGQQADVVEWVGRPSDGSVLIMGNHDDYLNGGSVRTQKEYWGGHMFQINAGDLLTFNFTCQQLNGSGAQGQWWVTAWTASRLAVLSGQ